MCSLGSLPHERYEDHVPLQLGSLRPEACSLSAKAKKQWPPRCGQDANMHPWTASSDAGVLLSLLSLPQFSREPVPGWRPGSTHGGDAQWGVKCFNTLYFSFWSHQPRIFVSVGARRKQLVPKQSRTPAELSTPAWRLSAQAEEWQGHSFL